MFAYSSRTCQQQNFVNKFILKNFQLDFPPSCLTSNKFVEHMRERERERGYGEAEEAFKKRVDKKTKKGKKLGPLKTA